MLVHVSGLALSLSCVLSILTPVLALQPIDPTSKVTFSKSNIADLDYQTLNPDTANFANGKTVVNVGDVPNLRKAVNVALPASGSSSLDAIYAALPAVLKDVGVPSQDIAAKVLRAAPLFDSALQALLAGQDLQNFSPSGLSKRGIFGDIWDFIVGVGEGIGCSTFATGALPGYLASAGLFAAGNSAGSLTTTDQNYFISALLGDLYKDNLRVIYRAWRPPGFGSADGTTYNKNMYIQHPQRDFSPISGFKTTMHLVLHEAVHVKQYKNLGYSLTIFGLKYLYDYCANGFSYNKIPFEVEAYAKYDDVNNLLIDYTGQTFFKIWKKQYLLGALGYPNAQTYTTWQTSPKYIYQLSFEKGYLQLTDGSCYRILSSSDLSKKSAASSCSTTNKCPKGSIDYDIKRRNAEPLPPVGHEPNLPTCIPSEMTAKNEACKRTKAEWAAIDAAKTFTCVYDLPTVL